MIFHVSPRASAAAARLLLLAGVALADPPKFTMDKFPASTRRLVINIGSSFDPILPPADDDAVSVIAVEPIVHEKIKRTPRLYVLPAAVAAEDGVAMMSILNKGGVSSSLSQPAVRSFWTHSNGVRLVPVIALRTLLASIPEALGLWYIRTDMQGHDFRTLSSVGDALARAEYVTAETWRAPRCPPPVGL